MGFLEIFLKLFGNLIGFLMSCFSNTAGHHDGGDEDQTTRASSSSTPPRQNYEVFLSFRGDDTRYGFTDFLYHGLKDKGIEVFRDNEELHAGVKIDQLFDAIKASKISIPIISPDYASSIWCLKELLQILECKKILGQLVLPIFYHVKPSDVREQKGNFGKNFRQCKRKHNLDGKSVQELENAFKEVATMKGWESDKTAGGYEGKLVKIVVTRIFNELRKADLVVPDFLVGIEDHVKEIKKMIDAKPNDAKIIGIYGMGGIGKTTLAKVLYNALCSNFECQSFVPNIREASKTKGMKALQKQIISDVLVDKSMGDISHDEEGITIIEKRFKGKKILLLLDDVEDKDQLNKLVTKNGWFGSESIVIITTRNKNVTEASVVNLGYELNELNEDQSYELFCKHAVRSNASCLRDLETLAKDIVSTTGGLPLAIEVIGSLLCQKDRESWEEALEKLRRVPHKEVRDKLKISYDYLEYEEQQIFLDIACFSYCGFNCKDASYMWKSCGFYPKEGIERLISLSLIKGCDGYYATIHDQLRDLGREIVRKEGRDNIGLCSRIWLEEEAKEVMQRKQGTDKVQALILRAEHNEKLHYTSEDFGCMTYLRFLQMSDVHLIGDVEQLFSNLKWLRWGIVHNEDANACIDFMGINFNPKKLVVLDLCFSNITGDWKGWSYMKGLKVIKLYGCRNLTTTPDFSALEGLEVMMLRFCRGLKKIHPSIGMLSKLTELNLWECKELKSLPILPSSLTSLCFNGDSMETLPNLSNLTNLVNLKYYSIQRTNGVLNLGDLNQLETLKITGSFERIFKISDPAAELDIVPENFILQLELPVSLLELEIDRCQTLHTLPNFSNFKNLSQLLLHNCSELKEINGLGGAESLTNLEIKICESLQHLPDLSQCTKLKQLDVEGCDKLREIRGLQELKSLESLKISGCNSLQYLPNLSQCTKLKWLDAKCCAELTEIRGLHELKSSECLAISGCKSLQHLPDLSQCKKLQRLDAKGCDEHIEMQGLQELKSLESLAISGCKSLQHLPDLSQCIKLKRLDVEGCDQLTEIRGLQELKSLKSLKISGCNLLQHLPDLSQCTKLKWLDVQGWDELIEIRGLQELKSLESLKISGCNSLKHLPDLSQCTKLKWLHVGWCAKLIEIRGLQELKSLKSIEILGCNSLQHLPNLSQYTKSKQLDVGCCAELTEIRGLHELKSLECLAISGCKSLQHLPDLSQCTKLQQLDAKGCDELIEIRGLQELKSLESLAISGCKSLQHLPDLSQCTKLQQLDARGCEELIEIRGLQEFKSLESLAISGCNSLQHLPDLSQCTKLLQLDVEGCEELTNIRGLQELKSLESLAISGWKSLQHLLDLSQCIKLKRLHVEGYDQLTEIRGLQELKSLESLKISGCNSLQHLPDLSQCTKLERLDVQGCDELVEIRGLQELKSLESLKISGCNSLQHLPDLSQCTKLKWLDVGCCADLTEIRGLQELKSLESVAILRCNSL